MQQTAQARVISRQEQEEMGLTVHRPKNYVSPMPAPPTIPTRHEVIDPYAGAMPQPVQYVVAHQYTPITRAQSVLIRTSAVTVALAILTAAAMAMLDGWGFLAWIVLASLEWVVCFVIVSVLDWRETPSALTWEQTNDYMGLMKIEQRARLKAIYGVEVQQ